MGRVLVVDEDPWTQRMVSAVLSQGGHEVDLAADGWEALIRVGRGRPDVVITEVRLPTTDGWSFASTLRSRADTAAVPIVFLASFGEDRRPGPGFRRGHDELVEKPFRLEQLEGVVRGMLGRAGVRPTDPAGRRAVRSDATPAKRAVLTGDVQQFSLSSVLIVLELERKTGVLAIETPSEIGRVFLREGRVIRAAIDGTRPRGGALAVYDMLAWVNGHFEFDNGEVTGDDEIASSTSFLLLEGARLQDEHNQQKETNN